MDYGECRKFLEPRGSLHVTDEPGVTTDDHMCVITASPNWLHLETAAVGVRAVGLRLSVRPPVKLTADC
jgi:hypothetical protein